MLTEEPRYDKSLMDKYQDYFLDYDGFYYPKDKFDVSYVTSTTAPRELVIIDLWFDRLESKIETSPYYIHTRLFFTYKSKKYYLSWTFYSKSLICQAIELLQILGAVDFQINYGRLD